jgi:hypothetical protein
LDCVAVDGIQRLRRRNSSRAASVLHPFRVSIWGVMNKIYFLGFLKKR